MQLEPVFGNEEDKIDYRAQLTLQGMEAQMSKKRKIE